MNLKRYVFVHPNYSIFLAFLPVAFSQHGVHNDHEDLMKEYLPHLEHNFLNTGFLGILFNTGFFVTIIHYHIAQFNYLCNILPIMLRNMANFKPISKPL